MPGGGQSATGCSLSPIEFLDFITLASRAINSRRLRPTYRGPGTQEADQLCIMQFIHLHLSTTTPRGGRAFVLRRLRKVEFHGGLRGRGLVLADKYALTELYRSWGTVQCSPSGWRSGWGSAYHLLRTRILCCPRSESVQSPAIPPWESDADPLHHKRPGESALSGSPPTFSSSIGFGGVRMQEQPEA
jgi:hypothetical protein